MQLFFVKHNVVEMDFLSCKESLYAAGMLPYLGQFQIRTNCSTTYIYEESYSYQGFESGSVLDLVQVHSKTFILTMI